MLTLPSTPKGTAKVQSQGVKINRIYYWCDKFRNPEVCGKQVDVRFDPFDVGTAFARVNGTWEECRSQYYVSLRGHSERELMLASQELRREKGLGEKARLASASQVARMLASSKSAASVLEQRLRDDETRAAQQSLALTPSIAGAEQMAAWSERQGEKEVADRHELAGEDLSLTVDRSELRKYGEF